MESEWYFVRAGERLGPYTLEAMKAHARDGTLSTSDLVWREGMSEWRPAAECPELGSTATPRRGPPPVPSTHPPMPTGLGVGKSLFQSATSLFSSSAKWVSGKLAALTAAGRWCRGGAANDWIELLPNNVVRTVDDRAGQWSLSGDGKHLAMAFVGETTQHFSIVQLTPFLLQLRTSDGRLVEYTKGRTADQARAEGEISQAVDGLVSRFTKSKCPACGKHAGSKAGNEKVTDSFGTAVAYRTGPGTIMKCGTVWQRLRAHADMHSENEQLGEDYTYGVVVVKTTRTATTLRCSECLHEWEVVKTREQMLPETFRDPDETKDE